MGNNSSLYLQNYTLNLIATDLHGHACIKKCNSEACPTPPSCPAASPGPPSSCTAPPSKPAQVQSAPPQATSIAPLTGISCPVTDFKPSKARDHSSLKVFSENQPFY